jgi:formate--tetrahydrofolate ligase
LGVKAILADEFTKGGEGMTELAEEVVNCAANCEIISSHYIK